jgi:hypothetical protein
MRRYLLCAGLAACAAIAVSAPPTTPKAGIVREPDGTLRPVYGFSANLINGRPLPLRDVLAASFSDDAGLVLTSGALKLVGVDGSEWGSYSTTESHAVLGIADRPETAIAWLPGEQKFVWWTSSAFSALPFDSAQLPGPIVALEASVPGSVDVWTSSQAVAVQHLRVSLATGRISPLESTAGVGSKVLVADSILIFHDTEGLEVRSSAVRTRTLPLPLSDLTFEKASTHWIHISSISTGRQWMLHLAGADATLSEIPAFSHTTVEATQ